ncbi:hypothetical protein [Pelotomaculum propionicicum]|uniref:Uncharacterized protein n=1 Tax=Pelotomaculum propionicicum TaxID=258475 RepID=A0A4Y7RS31_9FIRM|nr:hypothetical protein [Pelotomaculum propionicicum]NLI13174.1 hypothetical protein [Peptococcaceae bacterium]TEB11683.1 hypothetical protein Pmgp_01479 [Pelotomaculum propionicicum]
MSNGKLERKNLKETKDSKIHEPLSSYYPAPFEVENPTLQNEAPEYSPHSAVYVRKDELEKSGGK